MHHARSVLRPCLLASLVQLRIRVAEEKHGLITGHMNTVNPWLHSDTSSCRLFRYFVASTHKARGDAAVKAVVLNPYSSSEKFVCECVLSLAAVAGNSKRGCKQPVVAMQVAQLAAHAPLAADAMSQIRHASSQLFCSFMLA